MNITACVYRLFVETLHRNVFFVFHANAWGMIDTQITLIEQINA